jgi:hypothetical protein
MLTLSYSVTFNACLADNEVGCKQSPTIAEHVQRNVDLPCILDAINDEHHALHEFQCVRMAQGCKKLFRRSKNLNGQVSRGDVERQSIKHNLRRLSLIQSLSHTTFNRHCITSLMYHVQFVTFQKLKIYELDIVPRFQPHHVLEV